MIIKRDHYQELSWWQWARLRLWMAWGRGSGKFSRGLGLLESRPFQTHLAREATGQSELTCPFCGAQGHKSFKSH